MIMLAGSSMINIIKFIKKENYFISFSYSIHFVEWKFSL